MNFIISMYTSLVELINSMGYFGILIGMAIESSFFPLPSEVVLIPAGTLIFQQKLSFFLVFIYAVIGSLLGAFINYSLALFFGRNAIEFILEKRSFLFLKKENLQKIDNYFNTHGEITTFVGRLIPAARHLISLPAGFAKMNVFKFASFTCLGSGIWVFVLLTFGYFIGDKSELINQNISLISSLFLILSSIIIAIYIFTKKSSFLKKNYKL